MIKFSFETGSILVDYVVENVGRDLEISITGGDIHIGSVGLVSNGSYKILSVDNHKEHEIIKPLAKRLCKYKKVSILIKAGIHVDNITNEELGQIIENNTIALKKIDEYIPNMLMGNS